MGRYNNMAALGEKVIKNLKYKGFMPIEEHTKHLLYFVDKKNKSYKIVVNNKNLDHRFYFHMDHCYLIEFMWYGDMPPVVPWEWVESCLYLGCIEKT